MPAEAAADVLVGCSRLAIEIATGGDVPLPQQVRQACFGALRLTAQTTALLPRVTVAALDRIGAEIDAVEGATISREDLGSRLRREHRRQGPWPAADDGRGD